MTKPGVMCQSACLHVSLNVRQFVANLFVLTSRALSERILVDGRGSEKWMHNPKYRIPLSQYDRENLCTLNP
jgi:hypothetical protein